MCGQRLPDIYEGMLRHISIGMQPSTTGDEGLICPISSPSPRCHAFCRVHDRGLLRGSRWGGRVEPNTHVDTYELRCCSARINHDQTESCKVLIGNKTLRNIAKTQP